MSTYFLPICLRCTHFRHAAAGNTCDAFPNGIPEPILLSEADHRQPIDGDHGMQFAPIDSAAAQYAERLFSPATDTTPQA